MNNLYFPICAVMIAILICIVFFAKKRIKSEETQAYSFLIIFSLLESTLATIIIIITNMYGVPNYLYIMHRFDYAFILFWVWSLFNYVLSVSLKNSNIKNIIRYSSLVINLITIISISFLSLNVIHENGIIDTYGNATNTLYGTCAIYVVLIIILVLISLFKDIRNKDNKKYLPLLSLIVLSLFMLIIRSIYPQIILISYIAAYADLIMFFTIENPDIKVLHELNRNKRLLENSNEEELNLLFEMSQEVKKPLDDITNISQASNDSLTKDELLYNIMQMQNNALNLKNIVNNVLDVSTMDMSNLVISKNTYNIRNLLEEVIKNASLKAKKTVSVTSNISSNLPKELYGDSVKLKQVLMTIILNSCKYTHDGFIDINVNEIIKYDTCRLLIKIEDSGSGISIEKVNELLKNNTITDSKEFDKLNTMDLDLKLAFRVIKLLGGFINIKSEVGKGSTFIVIIDQKILQNTKTYYDKYDPYVFNNDKILLVSDKKEILKNVKGYLSKYNIDIFTTMYGKDCYDKVKNGQSYNFILLDDDMQPNSAYSTLGMLQEIKGFNTPCIVMLNKGKDQIKDHYINDGFDDYLLLYNSEQELARIIHKYIKK